MKEDSVDKRIVIIPPGIPNERKVKDQIGNISLDLIKSAYIVEGANVKQISDRFLLPLNMVRKLIKEERFGELRRLHIRHELQSLQNVQIMQAQEILELEIKFKNIRVTQLKTRLTDFMTYFEKHGDFYKRNPDSGQILLDDNEIPIQISLPTAAKELKEIKDAVIMAEGIKRILSQIEKVLKGEDAVEGAISIEDFFEQ